MKVTAESTWEEPSRKIGKIFLPLKTGTGSCKAAEEVGQGDMQTGNAWVESGC